MSLLSIYLILLFFSLVLAIVCFLGLNTIKLI